MRDFGSRRVAASEVPHSPMGRPKKFTRSEALHKAKDLFRKQGYHATSIDDLVRALGVNRASLYETFGGKRELFGEVLRNYTTESLQTVREFLAGQTSVREGFRRLFLYNLDEMKAGKATVGCLAVNTTTELLPADRTVTADLVANRNNAEAVFAEFIERGIAQGEVGRNKDAKAIAAFLFTFNHGLSVLAKLQSGREELVRSIDVALKAFD